MMSVERGLYLRQRGVPFDARAYLFGHDAMSWYRAEVALGRPSLRVPTATGVNIFHPICEKCHSLFCRYRVAFQQDGATIHSVLMPVGSMRRSENVPLKGPDGPSVAAPNGNVSNGGVVPWSADCPAN